MPRIRVFVTLTRDDLAKLTAKAKRLGVKPTTLAAMLVHAGLAKEPTE